MILKRYNEKRKGSEFVEMVKNRFKAGRSYELSDISKTRDEIYTLMNMPSVKKKPKDFLEEFFKCKDSWKNRQRAYSWNTRKFNRVQHFTNKPLFITPFMGMLYL